MDNMDVETFRPLFEAKRQQRVSEKQVRTEFARKVRSLDPEKRKQIEQLLG